MDSLLSTIQLAIHDITQTRRTPRFVVSFCSPFLVFPPFKSMRWARPGTFHISTLLDLPPVRQRFSTSASIIFLMIVRLKIRIDVVCML